MNSKMYQMDYASTIDEAIELREAGNTAKSLRILSKIVDEIPHQDVKALVVAGALLREGRKFEAALSCLNKAIESDPSSPGASLGLFHTLWNMGRYDDGFAELHRFLSISQSDEHFRLIEEMRDSLLDDDKADGER